MSIALSALPAAQEAPPNLVLLLMVVFGVVILLGFVMVLATRYQRCPSNKILVIYGKIAQGRSAKTLHGGGAFVWPLIQAYAYLDLEPMQIEIPLKGALSIENIRVAVPSVFTVAIGTDVEGMQNAAVRLLSLEQKDIVQQAEDIIFGQLRQVIASLAIQDINRDRDLFLDKIQNSLEPELKKIGLVLINVNIKDITDESGYIVAIGRKAAAIAVKQAEVDVADQNRKGAIGVAEAWLKKTPRDADALLALSGAYGLSSRLAVIERRWLRALFHGRRGIKLVRKAHRFDPDLYDTLLGIGMYDYYADTLPRFVGVLSRLILGGDRERGIERLKLVAEKGHYANVGAELILIEIYTEDRWGAKDPERALEMIERLMAKFPKSPMFHQIGQVCQYSAGRFDALLASATDYLRRIDEGWPYYPEGDRARQYMTIGAAHFAKKNFEASEKAFETAGELAGTSELPVRWGVWGLVRLGQVRDVLNRREEAVEAYRAAKRFPDIWRFRSYARRGIKTPYRMKEAGVDQLPPP